MKVLSDLPAGNYTFYAMIAEKTVNYNAPNGENVHHNVFREALPDDGGEAFTPPAAGNSKSYSYSFKIDDDWTQEETYILAFVQNNDTKEIINSGTKFDERTSTSLNLLAEAKPLRLSPNPVQDQLIVDFGQTTQSTASLKVYDTQGKLLLVQQVAEGTQQMQMDVAELPRGVLLVQLKNQEGLWSGKLIK